jgi:hypothetical protein
MTSIDRVLIDPNPNELAEALAGAAAAVNDDQDPLGLPVLCGRTDALDLERRMHNLAEGAREWLVPGHGLYAVEAALVAIWWTDFLGRRHLRLVGGSRHRGMELPVPLPSPHCPPLACVYPGACVVASQHRRSRVLAVCDCGAWGPPERLAWMGPHCGPCFDREDNELLGSPGVLPAGGSVHGVAFSGDGKRLAVLDRWGEVALWDVESGRPTALPRGSVGLPGKVAFSGDGQYLGWCSSREAQRRLRLVRLDDGQSSERTAFAFAFGPAPGQVIVAESPTALARHDLNWSPSVLARLGLPWGGAPVEPVMPYRLPYPILCRDLAVSPDGRLLAGAGGERGLCLWNAHSGEPHDRGDEEACGPLAWSPDGTVLACGVLARFWKAVLYDVQARQRRAVIGTTAALHALAFSPDGQWLLTCEDDGIRTWHVQTGQERRSLTLPGGERALALAFAPDGRTVALGMSSGRVRLWPADILHPDA